MEKISIIVPVYNSGKYLQSTIDKLKGQLYPNIEVILIDDGSTDGSSSICEVTSRIDNRFRYVRVENGGPGRARNIGLSLATGDLVGFCDSDDIIESDIYSTLENKINQFNADLVMCDAFCERDRQNFGLPWKDGTIFENKKIKTDLIASMIGNKNDDEKTAPVWGSVWRCLFRRRIIENNKIRFPEDIHFAEDLVFCLRYLNASKKVVICDRTLYYYRNNEDSIMNSFFQYKEKMFEARIKLIDYVKMEIRGYSCFDELSDRLLVTERCYFRECVGNACRNAKGRTQKDKNKELKMILNHDEVVNAFHHYHVSDRKTKMVYFMIKHKLKFLISCYYNVRFR